jgi:hypothetical protein
VRLWDCIVVRIVPGVGESHLAKPNTYWRADAPSQQRTLDGRPTGVEFEEHLPNWLARIAQAELRVRKQRINASLFRNGSVSP